MTGSLPNAWSQLSQVSVLKPLGSQSWHCCHVLTLQLSGVQPVCLVCYSTASNALTSCASRQRIPLQALLDIQLLVQNLYIPGLSMMCA